MIGICTSPACDVSDVDGMNRDDNEADDFSSDQSNNLFDEMHPPQLFELFGIYFSFSFRLDVFTIRFYLQSKE